MVVVLFFGDSRRVLSTPSGIIFLEWRVARKEGWDVLCVGEVGILET